MIERRERERERKKVRRRDIEREGEIRERERERGERESKILVKSPKPINKAQTKVDYTKLSLAIMSRNYQLVYYVAQK